MVVVPATQPVFPESPADAAESNWLRIGRTECVRTQRAESVFHIEHRWFAWLSLWSNVQGYTCKGFGF